MNAQPSWKISFEAELNQAETARASGNEGKARVCARRAAGIAVRAYLFQQGIQLKTPSAYDALRHLATLDTIPGEAREIVEHFLVKVNPEYALPIQADLITEARWLAAHLLEN